MWGTEGEGALSEVLDGVSGTSRNLALTLMVHLDWLSLGGSVYSEWAGVRGSREGFLSWSTPHLNHFPPGTNPGSCLSPSQMAFLMGVRGRGGIMLWSMALCRET